MRESGRSEKTHATIGSNHQMQNQFVFESPRIPLGAEFAEYARASFPAGRPLLDNRIVDAAWNGHE